MYNITIAKHAKYPILVAMPDHTFPCTRKLLDFISKDMSCTTWIPDTYQVSIGDRISRYGYYLVHPLDPRSLFALPGLTYTNSAIWLTVIDYEEGGLAISWVSDNGIVNLAFEDRDHDAEITRRYTFNPYDLITKKLTT